MSALTLAANELASYLSSSDYLANASEQSGKYQWAHTPATLLLDPGMKVL